MKKKLLSILLVVLSVFMLVSCTSKKNYKSDSLYVEKVENLKKDFIFGMDISSIISLEQSGVKFYNFEGKEQDIFKTLSESGVNYIRVRIWNNPYDSEGNGFGGGNNDIDKAIEIGKRATKYNMKLLVNFHYSDFWADPSKQMVPRAWQGMDVTEKSEALYEYTKDCLNKLKAAKVDVGMVQVGNETNAYFCGEKKWNNICTLMSAGSKAVREVFPKALVALHFANPENANRYPDYAYRLSAQEVDYDVFGSSYYPYWHGSLENLSEVLTKISTEYGKKVMVLETSYAFTNDNTDFFGNTISEGGIYDKPYPFTVEGQATHIRNLTDTINKIDGGIGICYWEGAWITVGQESYEKNAELWEKYGSGWASSYATAYDPEDAGKYYGGTAVDNQTFFDKDGKPLESLKVFNLLAKGNKVEPKVDGVENISLIQDLNGNVSFPTKVNTVLTDMSKSEVDIEWKSFGIVNADTTTTEIQATLNKDAAIEYMKSHGVAKYYLKGNIQCMDVYCYISMVEYNYVQNYSFETGNMDPWVLNKIKNSDQLYIEKKAGDSLTGDYHYHFWSEKNDSIEFTLSQTLANVPSGTYKYSISIMGGDGGVTDIYAYVKINGTIVKTAAGQITEWNEWHTMFIDDIEYNGTDTIEIGIYVKCGGAGKGAWGKIDDALFNSK